MYCGTVTSSTATSSSRKVNIWNERGLQLEKENNCFVVLRVESCFKVSSIHLKVQSKRHFTWQQKNDTVYLMFIFTRIKKLNVERSHLGTIRPMSQPIPLLPLSLLTFPQHQSQSHWRRARSRLTWLTSLNLSAWPPRLRLRLLQASDRGPEPETEGGDRSHLIEQLVALHTTCQLCPYKFYVMPW